jgi:hypothetical protein
MADKNQIMPPLLPLEYCTVDRAARLLNCEVEDIYHWLEIGAIDLYLNYDGAAKLSMEQVEMDDEGLFSASEFANEIAGGWKEQVCKVQSHMSTSYSKFAVTEFIHNPVVLGVRTSNEVSQNYIDFCESQSLSPSHEGFVEYCAYYDIDFFIEDNVQVESLELYEQSILNPGNDIYIQCSGYWKLDFSFIDEADEHGINCTFLHYHETPEITGFLKKWSAILYIYDLDIHIPKKQYPHSLYLIKSDLQKIYRATHGLEELQTIYNNSNLYRMMMHKREKQTNEPPKRLRNEQVIFIRACAKKILDVDDDHIDKHFAAAETLLTALSDVEKKLPSLSTVARYLGAKKNE